MTNLDEIEIDGITYGLGGLTIDLNDSEFGEPNQIDADTLGGKPASDYLLKSEVYPVGSIYISLNSTNPSSIFGGTWEQIQGRFLLGQGLGYSAGAIGGEANHTLSIQEMPSHQHNLKTTSNGSNYFSMLNADSAGGAWVGDTQFMLAAKRKVGSTVFDGTITTSNLMTGEPIDNTGGGSAHNNMPPYLAVYMWKRTA